MTAAAKSEDYLSKLPDEMLGMIGDMLSDSGDTRNLANMVKTSKRHFNTFIPSLYRTLKIREKSTGLLTGVRNATDTSRYALECVRELVVEKCPENFVYEAKSNAQVREIDRLILGSQFVRDLQELPSLGDNITGFLRYLPAQFSAGNFVIEYPQSHADGVSPWSIEPQLNTFIHGFGVSLKTVSFSGIPISEDSEEVATVLRRLRNHNPTFRILPSDVSQGTEVTAQELSTFLSRALGPLAAGVRRPPVVIQMPEERFNPTDIERLVREDMSARKDERLAEERRRSSTHLVRESVGDVFARLRSKN